jgi:hypothetical protein
MDSSLNNHRGLLAISNARGLVFNSIYLFIQPKRISANGFSLIIGFSCQKTKDFFSAEWIVLREVSSSLSNCSSAAMVEIVCCRLRKISVLVVGWLKVKAAKALLL